MLLKKWTFRRLITVSSVLGMAAAGYYCGIHIPQLRQQCRPLPPQRQTPLFVAGMEEVPLQKPRGLSQLRFFTLVAYRFWILVRNIFPIICELLLAVCRGEIILHLRGGHNTKNLHPSPTGVQGDTVEVVLKDAYESSDLQKCIEDAVEEHGISSVVSCRLPSNSCIWDLILSLLKSMGPAYIKMGQWAATRPDIFPESLITKLSELFDSAPAHSWEYTKRELERQGLLDHLENIEPEPLNSGSAGQVHCATLKSDFHVEPMRISATVDIDRDIPVAFWWFRLVDHLLRRIGIDPTAGVPTDVADLPRGTPVVVKILHPRIEEEILADVAIIRFLAWALSKLPGVEYLSLRQSAKEVAVLLLSQLDLRRECDNLLTFRYNFIGNENVRFPVPVPQLTSSNVLVESFEQGTPIIHVEPDRQIAELSFQAFCRMLLVDNFVHADLHPGNLLVRYRRHDGTAASPQLKNDSQPQLRRDPSAMRTLLQISKSLVSGTVPDKLLRRVFHRSAVEIVFLDPGLVTSLSAKERSNFVALFTAIAVGDGRLAGRLLLERAPYSMCTDEASFFNEMQDLIDHLLPRVRGLPSFCFANIEFGTVLGKAFDIMRNHKVRVEGAFATLVASVVVGEGLGRMMDPDFNILGASVPFLLTYLQQHEMKELFSVLSRTYSHV